MRWGIVKKVVKSDWAAWVWIVVYLTLRNWHNEGTFQLVLDVINGFIVLVMVVKYVKIGRMK